MRLITRDEGYGFVGAASVGAGLYGLWGWPASALFVGAFLLTLSAGISMARKR